MVVVLVRVFRADTRPLESLLVRQAGQHAKHHRSARLDLDVHQPVGDGLGDVLKVHGRSFDKHSDSDQRVVRLRGVRNGARSDEVGGSSKKSAESRCVGSVDDPVEQGNPGWDQ